MQSESHVQEHGHPQPREYVKIAVILAVITAIEVMVVYLESFAAILIPVLLIMSALKFSLVVLWFMHLKFDSRLFSSLFIGGLMLAALVLISLLFLLHQVAVVE